VKCRNDSVRSQGSCRVQCNKQQLHDGCNKSIICEIDVSLVYKRMWVKIKRQTVASATLTRSAMLLRFQNTFDSHHKRLLQPYMKQYL
jgi:hypothetical protein